MSGCCGPLNGTRQTRLHGLSLPRAKGVEVLAIDYVSDDFENKRIV